MNRKSFQRIYGVSALITFTAVVFTLFFQVNKGGPFRDINPFGEDPYDVVGSFAIQIALLVGILTTGRALRLKEEAEQEFRAGDELRPMQAAKMRLILRGNFLVLMAILVTLAVDVEAVSLHPLPPTFWGNVLMSELALMFLLTAVCFMGLLLAFWQNPSKTPPGDLTPADAIDDLWTLVRVPVLNLGAALPHGVVEWVRRFKSDWLFAPLPWLNPRRHPWGFACILGACVGVGLVLAQLQEGPPPSLQASLFLAGIFISAEFVATLAGFAMFGGYLGLRPAFGRRR